MLIELLSSLWFKNPSIGHVIKGYWLILEHFLWLAFKIFCFFSLLFLFFSLFFPCCFYFCFFFLCFLLFFCCFLLFLFLAGKVSKVKDLTEQILSGNLTNFFVKMLFYLVNWCMNAIISLFWRDFWPCNEISLICKTRILMPFFDANW